MGVAGLTSRTRAISRTPLLTIKRHLHNLLFDLSFASWINRVETESLVGTLLCLDNKTIVDQ